MLNAENPRDNVRVKRRYLKLSRKEVAKMYGCSYKTVSAYENGYPARKYWEWILALEASTPQSSSNATDHTATRSGST